MGQFYNDQKALFLNLPTYHFDREKYWIDAVPINRILTNNDIKPQDIKSAVTEVAKIQITHLLMRKNNLVLKIKQVLEDASGIEMHNVESNQNFLEIGLDSPLLTQRAISLKREFNLPFTFRKLNEECTNIDSLTDYTDKNTSQKDSNSVQTPSAVVATAPLQLNKPSSFGNSNDHSNSALELVAHPVEILSKQVLLMHGANAAGSPVLVQPKLQEESELTLQEKTEIQKPFVVNPNQAGKFLQIKIN